MEIKQLKDYLLSMPKSERHNFAQKCGTTLGQLIHIYYGNRKCNPALAIEIDKHSNGAVKCDVLSPNTDFDYIRQQNDPSDTNLRTPA